MKHKILFIDDNDQILKAVKRVFQYCNYQIFSTTDADSGFSMLTNNKTMGVIVSDMRMPGMSGVEFLKKAKNICPDAIAIIISAYSDKRYLIDAINESHIWKYILKPWENNDLKLSIKNAIHLFEQKMENKQLLQEVARVNIKVEKLNTILVNKNKRLQQEMKYHYPNKAKKRRYGYK